MASLNQDATGMGDPGLTNSPSTAAGLDEVAGAETASARAISRRGEEARGGFVLRAKSDEMPHRRRSLVERTGMKSIVQARNLIFVYSLTPFYCYSLNAFRNSHKIRTT